MANNKLHSWIKNIRMELASSNKNVTNVDLLKRISDLEKVVYGE